MPNAKRILLVVTQAHWGGVQSFLLHFAQELQKHGHIVLLAAAGEGLLWQRAEAAGIKTHRLQRLRRDIHPFFDYLALRELQELYQAFQPDAIHLNSSKIGILGSLAAVWYRKRFPHVRLVYRIGGWAFLEPQPTWKTYLYLKAEQWTAPYKDVILTVHPGDEVLARTYSIIPRESVRTAANGLDVEAFQSHLLPRTEARATLGLPPESFVFGIVSNAYATKGLIPFFQALPAFLSQNPQARVCLLGDGPEFDTLKNLAATSFSATQAHLEGQRADATRLYRAFDAFVLPSQKEGMPWALLEAMAAQLPCIATDVGACRWMLEGGPEPCGLIVPKGDQAALHRAMQSLLDEEILCQQYAAVALQNVRSRFTWERTFEANAQALLGD